MQKNQTNLLKSNEVKIEGQFHLDVGPTAAPPQQQANPNLAASHVRILENHPEYALIELTCTCGNKSHIKCQYEDPKSTSNEPQQN